MNETRFFSKAGQLLPGRILGPGSSTIGSGRTQSAPGGLETRAGENPPERDREEARESVFPPQDTAPLNGGRTGMPRQDSSFLIPGTGVWIDGGESLLQG